MPTGADLQYGQNIFLKAEGRDGILVIMCLFWSSRVGSWTDFFFLDSLQVGGGTCHLLDSFDAYVFFFFLFLPEQTDTATQLKEQLEININITVHNASAVG